MDPKVQYSIGLFRTFLPTQPCWTFASGVKGGSKKLRTTTCVDVYHRNEYGAVVLNFARKITGLISTSRRQFSEAFPYENNHVLISRVPLSVGC